MGCANGCGDQFNFSLQPDWRPPQGGWQLDELPASIEERLRWAWTKRTNRSANNNGHQAIDEATAFLRQNGVAVTPALKLIMSQKADDQWCAAEPQRCAVARAKAANLAPVVANEPTPVAGWAAAFWQSWNRVLAQDSDEPAELMARWAQSAQDLATASCSKCAEHWRTLRQANPTTACDSNPKARLWLWKMHNASREGLPPTPLQDVIAAWEWPAISGAEASALLSEMGINPLGLALF